MRTSFKACNTGVCLLSCLEWLSRIMILSFRLPVKSLMIHQDVCILSPHSIWVYCYKTTASLVWAVTKFRQLEPASTLRSLQRMPGSFATYVVLSCHAQDHCHQGMSLRRTDCMLKCYVCASGLSLLTIKVPWVSVQMDSIQCDQVCDMQTAAAPGSPVLPIICSYERYVCVAEISYVGLCIKKKTLFSHVGASLIWVLLVCHSLLTNCQLKIRSSIGNTEIRYSTLHMS